MDPLILAIIVLSALAVGGLLYAIFAAQIENEQKRNKRMAAIASNTGSVSRLKKSPEAEKRRKKVAETLSDLDDKNKEVQKNVKKPPLKIMIRQSGLTWSMPMFYMVSAGIAFVAFFAPAMLGMPLIYGFGTAFVGFIGIPRWFVGWKRKRRMAAFLEEFPNAIEVIVRAIRSGLPLNDGLKLIAQEAKEPVKTEFQRIVDRQNIGMSTSEACQRMYESMPVSEANFFGVVIQIQSQAGGNLGEALGNLAGVLRSRKSMKGKIAAMSMEAKASGYIIGALPFIVALLVHFTTPDYLVPLFTTDTGSLILGVSAVWMGIGIFVMKNMINFDF